MEIWEKMRKVFSRSSGFIDYHSSLPRLFMVTPLGSQHPDHTRTKTSWKSRNVPNQPTVWSIGCQLISKETTLKSQLLVAVAANQHSPSVWHIWHVTQYKSNIWHHEIFVENPTLTTDYIGSVINLSTLPTGGQKFPPFLEGLAQGASHGVGRFSCPDSWNQAWQFWWVSLLGPSSFPLHVCVLSVLQNSV